MKRSTKSAVATLALATGLLLGLARPSAANDNCFYKGTMFSSGAASCQSGMQYRCDEGEWVATRDSCTGAPVTLSRSCDYNSISYSTGSASCQAGTQYRCEDGAWHSLGTPCSIGDSPVRAMPSGRSCMFDGATVASSSTICRSGTTFVCSDGEWVNLGTMCR